MCVREREWKVCNSINASIITTFSCMYDDFFSNSLVIRNFPKCLNLIPDVLVECDYNYSMSPTYEQSSYELLKIRTCVRALVRPHARRTSPCACILCKYSTRPGGKALLLKSALGNCTPPFLVTSVNQQFSWRTRVFSSFSAHTHYSVQN